MITKRFKKSQRKISAIKPTTESISGRAGILFFKKYIENIELRPHINRLFGKLRKSKKGKPIFSIFSQMFSFFLDGTSRHIAYFDQLKKDEGYAGMLELPLTELCSSHAIKRFFQSFSFVMVYKFRLLLQRLFLWQLAKEKPDIIILDMDSMVLDNKDAKMRQGVSWTYKKVNGFHPFHISWNGYIIDTVFRGGKKHSNNGNTAKKAVTHIVKAIRKKYDPDVPIIITSDSGFYDKKLFRHFEELEIFYVCTGKIYKDIAKRIQSFSKKDFFLFKKKGPNQNAAWLCIDFRDKRGVWKKSRRVVFTSPCIQGTQGFLYPGKKDRLYYTNLEDDCPYIDKLLAAGGSRYLSREGIVQLAHGRGVSELTHRHLKNFGFEKLPFLRFNANAAFYYMMLVSFFLYESYKYDCLHGIVTLSCYASTLRRHLIDFAGKIVNHSGKLILKIPEAVYDRLNLCRVWSLVHSPPIIS